MHWIEDADTYYREMYAKGVTYDEMQFFTDGRDCACSACGEKLATDTERIEDYRFCPFCGAEAED